MKILKFVVFWFLLPLKLFYRWENKNYFEKLPRLSINTDYTDSRWLSNEVKNISDPREDDCLSFVLLKKKCEEKQSWDLAKIFGQRKISAKEVTKAQISELVDLPSADFFAILDLLSGDQSMQLLKEERVSQDRKKGLYYFSAHLAQAYAYRQRELCSLPLEIKVQEAADMAFLNLKKFSPYQMGILRFKPQFAELDQARFNASITYQKNPIQIHAFKKLDVFYIEGGLPSPVTATFMTWINSALRCIHVNPWYPPKDLADYTGFRGSRIEGDEHSLPGHEVTQEMGHFIEWLNNELDQCDNRQSNPIVLAALVYQKIVTIQPWIDGNGRTGRYLADLILRRYGLLPAAWDPADTNKAVHVLENDRETPSNAVTGMLKALQRSYELIQA